MLVVRGDYILGDNNGDDNNGFLDIGRIRLNRKKQKKGLGGLKSVFADNNGNGSNNSKIKPVLRELSGLFTIFHDGDNYWSGKVCTLYSNGGKMID